MVTILELDDHMQWCPLRVPGATVSTLIEEHEVLAPDSPRETIAPLLTAPQAVVCRRFALSGGQSAMAASKASALMHCPVNVSFCRVFVLQSHSPVVPRFVTVEKPQSGQQGL
jgi:hypothetical protein